jgi:amino acid transporter
MLPSGFDVGTFFSFYTMIMFSFVAFVLWKVIKRTKFVKPTELDLVWVRPPRDSLRATVKHDAE